MWGCKLYIYIIREFFCDIKPVCLKDENVRGDESRQRRKRVCVFLDNGAGCIEIRNIYIEPPTIDSLLGPIQEPSPKLEIIPYH